jgi:hypothetical protein
MPVAIQGVMDQMARRDTLSISTHPEISKRFREAAGKFDGRIGLCHTAAMLMFLEADPEVQGDFINRAFNAQLKDQVQALLDEIREQQASKVRTGAPRSEKRKSQS